jgi:hypothetical protein
VLEDARQHQQPVFRGLLGPRLEKAVRASEPSRCRPDLPAVREIHSDPRGRASRPERLAAFQVEVMCPLQCSDGLVVAGKHQERRRQQLEIVRRERFGLVGASERLRGREPRALGVRGAGVLEVALGRAHPHGILQQVPSVGFAPGRLHRRAGRAETSSTRCR